MGSAPVLETAPLRMRGHRTGDFGEMAAMWADPNVTRYFGGRPFTEEEAWTRLLRYAGHWTLLGFGYWLVEEKATGRFLGDVGFADYKRDIQPPITDFPELGWVLVSRAHGQGYATEAATAALAWGEQAFEAKQTVCLIHPDNAASLRVAEKCGYRELRMTTYRGQPTIVFGRPAQVTACESPV